MKLTKGDKVLVVFLILFSIIFTYFMATIKTESDSKYISIQIDGNEINQIFFTEDKIGEQIRIETEYGYNILEIGDGEVKIIDASCLDKICIKQGSISEIGQLLVCLPNRLVVEVKSIDNDGGIDNFAF